MSLILLFSMGCSFLSFGPKGASTPDPAGGQVQETQQVASPAGNESDSVASLVEGNYEPVKVELPVWGKVNFSIDSSKNCADGISGVWQRCDA